jgi:hypothetical protein
MGQGFTRIEIDPELAKAAGERLARRSQAGDEGRRLGAEGRQLAAEGRRQQLLAAARNRPQASIQDLLDELGFSRPQYERWRVKHVDFREQFDAIRSKHAAPYDLGFIRWRAEFLSKSTPPHQRTIIDTIETAPPLTAHLILFPPNAGKSTTLVEYLVYRICKDPNIRIQWWSKDQEEANKRLRLGMNIMTDATTTRGADGTWGKVIGRFGPFYERGQERNGRPWRNDKIVVAKSQRSELDGTWECKGIKTNTQGTRANIIVIDDPQDDQNIGDSAKILHNVRAFGATRLHPENGILIWLATRVDVNDVYDLMLTLPDDELFLSSIQMIPALDEDGVSYWPEGRPYDQLMAAKKIVGQSAWARCYMMDPINAGETPFPKRHMELAKNRSLRVGTPVPDMPAILTMDPGLSPTGTCAVLVASVLPDFRLRLVEHKQHFNFAQVDDFIGELERCCIAYPQIRYVAVEDNNYQKLILNDAKFAALVSRYDLEVFEHTTGRNKQAHDLGITELGRGYKTAQVDIPWADADAAEMFGRFIEQHIKWRAGIPDKVVKQDCVIVDWIAWRVLQKIKAKMVRDEQAKKSEWNTHRPVHWGQPQRRTA